NATGAELATGHLLDRGAQRILALGGRDAQKNGSTLERTRGYQQAHRIRGHAVDGALLRPAAGWTMGDGAELVRDAIAGGLEFDAVFGFNDTLALGALAELSRHEIAVPNAVQVAG